MNEPNTNPNALDQTTALTRFKALNFIEDLRRSGAPLAEARRQASLRAWPDENGDYYAVRTLEDWWYAYQKGGFGALVPAPRSDQGKSRVLDEPTAAWVLEQVTQNPTVPLKVLYAHWQQSGRTLPSISVLYRYLRRQGMDRRALRSGRLETGATKAFEAPHVNDLWMVDFSPGPTLSVNGKTLSTQLCVLVDDHSRLIPFAAYYPQANTEAFHHAFKEALLRRGLPRKLYTDNGKPFINAHSHHWRDLFPSRVVSRIRLHLGSLLFALLAAALCFEGIRSGEPRGTIKPAGKAHSPAQRMRFPGQNNEYDLRHLLRKIRVTDQPKGR